MNTVTMSAKVALLLNQAENTQNEAERQAFMDRAQKLATLHSIDVAKARHALVAKERTTPIVRDITLGQRGTKGLTTLVTLIHGIANANNVRINISRKNSFVIAFGFEEDIDAVEALYASLTVQMAQAAEAHRKLGVWKEDTRSVPQYEVETDEDWYGNPVRRRYFVGYETKPVSWLTARLDFQEGFGNAVALRLALAKRDAERNAVEEDATTGTELVLVEKKAAVEDFYNAKSTARGSYKGYSSKGTSSGYAGHAAGQRAHLSTNAAMPGARQSISA